MNDGFELLLRKDIIGILDGDVALGASSNGLFRMPYLKGTDLCELSDLFGLHQEYGSSSRWTYLYNLLKYVTEKDRCDELLCYMFDMERFTQLEVLDSGDEIIQTHRDICLAVIKAINSKLALGRHELQVINGHFYVCETGKIVQIQSPRIKEISVPYVQDLPKRCKADFISGNYDSVISKSRTMIEEALIHILENRNIPIKANGDIGKLYNQVKSTLHMQQDKSYDGRVNSVLYGLERIVESIGAMRNSNSDAHGVGRSRIIVKEREARLAMNAAITFCEYVLSVGE